MLKKYVAPEIDKKTQWMFDVLTMSNDIANDTDGDNMIENPDGEIFG